MSHTPVLTTGAVIKRKLNAIRPVSGSGGGGGAGLVFYYGETLIPADTVIGAAKTARDDFIARLSVLSPETFEEFFGSGSGTVLDDVPLTSNGNAFHILLGSNSILQETNNNGRFNTTPGGADYCVMDSGSPLTFVFDNPCAGFGCFFTDMGDFSKAWTATIVDEFAVPTVIPIGNTINGPDGSLIFFGWLNTTGLLYSSVTFTASPAGGSSDAVGIDDIYTPSTGQIT